MFGVPGESFIDNWLSFIVFVVILVTVVLIISKIAKTRKRMHTGNFLSKFLSVVTYPFTRYVQNFLKEVNRHLMVSSISCIVQGRFG